MNAHHDLERRLADYYGEEAPRQAPDRVLHAALTSIETTRQRRVLIPALRRFHDMNASAKALVAAAAIVVGVLALAVFGPSRPGSNGPGVGAAGSPSPSPAASSAQPSSSPSASAARPSPSALALTESFTSAVFGVSTSYPAGWHVAPATKLWTTGIPWNCGQPDPCPFDQIWEKPDDSQLYHLASQPLGGKSGAEWGSAILADPGWEATCAKTTEPISIDGTPGTMAKICGQSLFVAVTSKGGRGYAFVLYRSDDVNAFKQLLATVRLHPEAAASEMPSARPS
ncbi:MAG TPA: hypothetical protein VFJ71_00955 [Candidatus Limnocylindrales bacterium]|nr:hypothetical protein [Candidatus Limnocylindrales bacterium]